MKRRVPFAVLLGAVLLGVAPLPAAGQNGPVVRDPQAFALVNQAIKALDGQAVINDVVLEGTLSFTAGSDEETGSATFEGKVGNKSKVVLNLNGGQRQEIRSGQAGAWIGADQQKHLIALDNGLTDAVWFFPGLSLQAALANPTLAMSYVGEETREGLAVQHLRLSRVIPGQSAAATALIQALSTMDLYLDATSSLPVAIDLDVHPDGDASTNIPVEIQFGLQRDHFHPGRLHPA